ncbi:MAG: ABC transporter permease [Saprospiraceae bacterium]|nr:ABC transporter permease [Saprospiraceae bacterium]
MLSNYFKIARRNILKQKGFSFINIIGLSMGMTVAILIGLWVYDEISFDGTNEKKDRIVQVMQHVLRNGYKDTQVWNPYLMAEELRNNYGSDFEYVVQTMESYDVLKNGEKKIQSEGWFSEKEIKELLTFDMIAGSAEGLSEPYSIMLSSSVATGLFDKGQAIDKSINVNDEFEVKVVGVYKDFPTNSSFNKLAYVMPWQLYLTRNSENLRSMEDPWRPNFTKTYALLPENADLSAISAKIKDTRLRHLGPNLAIQKPEVFLHPMRKWHLYEKFENGVNTGGSIAYVWLFGLVGLFVLALASINFMNLYTAQADKKAKEVGVRKAIGSKRSQLIFQYLSESVLTTFLALIISIILSIAFLNIFNEVAGKTIQFPYSKPLFWVCLVGFMAIVGLISGSYPAVYLSSFAPIKVLKGTFKAGKYASLPRKALVVLQFTVSISLVIGTLVVYQQIKHAQQRPLGYEQGELIFTASTNTIHNSFDAVKRALMEKGLIEDMAEASAGPTWTASSTTGITWQGRDKSTSVEVPFFAVSVDYGNTIGWNLKTGRDFSRDFDDVGKSFVVNEAAVRLMGFTDPVGQMLDWDGDKFTLVGVVEDMVVGSPFQEIQPMFYYLDQDKQNILDIKLAGGRPMTELLEGVKNVLSKFDPEHPFDVQFVDESYAQKFDLLDRLNRLINIFAFLAILISCMGLFGLASFMSKQRAKEIGVRKVLGATITNLWALLSRDFIVLVIISLLIAAPIATYFMSDWLLSFDYKTEISWWTYALTGLGAILVTLVTVSYQSIKAALLNPVKSLKSE